jgi:DNA-binding winged helix-turn-helix (wHTH) protein/Tfp pilus assembly protein PilF
MQGNSKEIQTARGGAYRFGAFELHPAERQLYSGGTRVALPPKAFDALLILVSNAERLVRKDELMKALWPETFVEEANLTNTVVTLRKVLGRTSIETVSKFGYRFTIPVSGEPGVANEVYATFVQAKQVFAAKSADSARAARDLFLLCVTKDPSFAPAWAWLGRCYRFLEKFGVDATVNADLAHEAFRRALAIDSRNAAAHQFFTNLQADAGQAREAMVRLRTRIAQGDEDAASYAGLVQTMRFCGLLRESVEAHDKAAELDPSIETSVAHTYFLLCDYQSAIRHYPIALKFYLDVAAWAASGNVDQARRMIAERTNAARSLPTLMRTFLVTLDAALAGDREAVLREVAMVKLVREPESVFYLARHCAMVGAAEVALPLLKRARTEGFVSSYALRHDAAFHSLGGLQEFVREVAAAEAEEETSRSALRQTAGEGQAG